MNRWSRHRNSASKRTLRSRSGSMMTLFFNSAPVNIWSDADRSDRDKYARYFWGMIGEGVYLPCSQFEALFLSRTHSEAIIEETIAAAEKVFRSSFD